MNVLSGSVYNYILLCDSRKRNRDESVDTGVVRNKRGSTTTIPTIAEDSTTTIPTIVCTVIDTSKGSSKGRYKCIHKRRRSQCKDCGGGAICEHKRIRRECKDCGGSAICEHKRIRSRCKDCGGGAICEHKRIRSQCKDCKQKQNK